MFPMVTCSAFSLELHLKCLILIEGGRYGKLHDLKELFLKVAPKSQKIIRNCYETRKPQIDARFATVKDAPIPKTDFDFVLDASAKAFEKFSLCVRRHHPKWAGLACQSDTRLRKGTNYRIAT
jgi:HEPN domain-containing protein